MRCLAALSLVLLACDGSGSGAGAAASAVSAALSATVPPPPAAPEPPPAGCQAKGDAPVELGRTVASVLALASDETRLFYLSWDPYGARGDVGIVRKDGKGASKVTGLSLEPRALVVDGPDVIYTSGIRLHRIAKEGGEERKLADAFAAQDLALHAGNVYGVPADYGPYDRVARVPARSGPVEELLDSPRKAGDARPTGWNRIAVDDTGIYFTDAGGGRVVRAALDGKSKQILASGRPGAFGLAFVGETVLFTLAKKGELHAVARKGGAVRKVLGGLAEDAPLEGDSLGAVTVLAGAKEGEPQRVVAVPPDGGAPATLGQVPAGNAVTTMALDGDCAYWTERVDATKTLVWARKR